MKELEEILLGGMFRPTEQNCPTREGELIESLDKIHDIPNPRVGMRVYVENTEKEYIIKSLKDKTIGGVNVPNAAVNVFEESDGLLKGDIEVLRQRAVDIRNSGIAGINADTLSLKFASLENSVIIYDIPAATSERAGVMSAKDKRKLDAAGNGATKIVWDASSNMNDFKTPGVYDIYGERTRQDDNLPILNASSGHSIAARLTVVASTLQPANNEICVTQFLQLSNRVGGEGATYVRTYNKNNNSMNGWSAWQKQMGMVETYMNGDNYGFGFGKESDGIDSGVGLHYFIDNGIYSGVYVDDKYILGQSNTPSFVETFVLVVINDYAASGKLGMQRHITQLKYAVDAFTGQSTVKKRVGTGNDIISWGDWEDIGGGNTYLNPNDYLELNYLLKLGVGTFEFSGTLIHDDIVGSIWRYIYEDLNIQQSQFNMKVVIDSPSRATATIMGCGKYDIVTFNPSKNQDVVSILNNSTVNS